MPLYRHCLLQRQSERQRQRCAFTEPCGNCCGVAIAHFKPLVHKGCSLAVVVLRGVAIAVNKRVGCVSCSRWVDIDVTKRIGHGYRRGSSVPLSQRLARVCSSGGILLALP